jgi:D-amino-acid dehydrogenase
MHVAVLGGGVIGLMTAWSARRRGFTVTVVDRQPSQRDGCSFGNAGMLVPSHFIPLAAPGMVALGLKWMWNPESPFYIRPRASWDLVRWAARFWQAATKAHVARSAPLLRDLHLQSRLLYQQLAAEFGNEFGLVEAGLVMLCKSEKTLDEETHVAEQARELGIPAERLDPAELAQLDPAITMSVAGGIYFPRDCHLSPNRLMEGIERRLAAEGVQFRWSTEVTGLRTEGGRIRAAVLAGERPGELEADQFVLCGGVWSEALGKGLELSIPMQAGKGYSVTLEQPRQLPRLCSILTEARVAVTPMGSALRLGGTMELAGINDRVDPRRVRGITRAIPSYFPEFRESDFSGLVPWHGLRPCSPDGLPYLGRTARWNNLVVATGHAMMGISLGAVTGDIVGRLLSNEPTAIDISLLSPDRYR